jgi:RND family efflux transporter MFP subunit
MPARTRLVAAAIALTLAAGGVATLLSRHAGTSAPPPSSAAPARVELAATDLVAPVAGAVRETIALTGTLTARNQTVVKAKIAGELKEMLVREGQTVRAGQIVARIDPTEADARLQEKLADLAGGKAQLAYSTRNLDQQSALLKQSFISENAFENAQSSHRVAESRLKALEAQVAIARKAVDDTVVRAPMNGVVAERFAQPGEKVAVDGKLAAIVDLDPLELEAAVPASDIPAIRVGQEVSFRVEGYDGREFRGAIDRISPATREGTRSINVYAMLPNADGALRAGMFAKGGVTIARRSDATTVPISAIREDEAAPYVYVVEGERMVKQPVKVGVRDEQAGVAEVSGLAPDARVVRANLGALRVGAPVAVVGDAR